MLCKTEICCSDLEKNLNLTVQMCKWLCETRSRATKMKRANSQSCTYLVLFPAISLVKQYPWQPALCNRKTKTYFWSCGFKMYRVGHSSACQKARETRLFPSDGIFSEGVNQSRPQPDWYSSPKPPQPVRASFVFQHNQTVTMQAG